MSSSCPGGRKITALCAKHRELQRAEFEEQVKFLSELKEECEQIFKERNRVLDKTRVDWRESAQTLEMAKAGIISKSAFDKVERRFRRAGVARMDAYEAADMAEGTLSMVEKEIAKYQAILAFLQD